jgi:radical SAM superfamily enzyme YgiQ (UPF0313 family)
VASGIRMDLALLSADYIRELSCHHVGGRLKVAPEHVSTGVLAAMRKPPCGVFLEFARRFKAESEKAGKEQFLAPYFIAGHPGSDLKSMVELAVFLKERGYKPDQVQDFIPAPFDVATAMYYTGRDPMSGKEVPVARSLRERRWQKALAQYFKPENYSEVREALLAAGRGDLIGEGPGALIGPRPPRSAFDARRAPEARAPAASAGYRPKRAAWRRRSFGGK